MRRASIPSTGKPYGPRFPDITVSDIVATQRALLDDLGIEHLVAIVGPSYGGFQAFQWAVDYPGAMRGIAAIVTAPKVPRERADGNVERLLGTLTKDPNWNGGDYYDRGGVPESMIQIRSRRSRPTASRPDCATRCRTRRRSKPRSATRPRDGRKVLTPIRC